MARSQSFTLKEWIEEVGSKEVARLLGVDGSAVRHWSRGHCLPRSEQMLLIFKYSRGRVTYQEMIETFQKQKQKSKREAIKG